jgi:phytoene dehydrogenase-like protein
VNGSPDAVVVGAGPNGLAAALRLAAAGLRVQVVEAAEKPGGGMRTEELIRPGYHHDVCSSVQPMAAAAPFFREWDPESRGVRLVRPEINFAHPLDGGGAALNARSLEETVAGLGIDGPAYRRMFEPLVAHGTDVLDFFLTSRLRRPPTRSVPQITAFGLAGLANVHWLTHRVFATEEARAMVGGAAAHGMIDLSQPLTAALGMLLVMLGHHVGWPLIEGGSQRLADALISALEQQGGEVVCGHEVTDLREFDGVPAVLLDTTPEAFVAMGGDRVHEGYRRWVSRYHHGAGVFKIDWILSEPVPWTNPDVRRAGTVHLAGTLDETIAGEHAPNEGRITDRPYVLAVQPTVPDPSRAPEGGHIFWAYVHVPHGSDADMTEAIENQVERFAPGFRDTIVERATKTAVEMERWNISYLGGDISNGQTTLRQMLARPVPRWNTYKTPIRGVYLASAATPPGPAVHGACGDNAARVALREVFGLRHVPPLKPALR